jgi:glycosyltransferase involved in cell wall biosynthesis
MITVIIPTLNEEATIGPLIDAIYDAVRASDAHIIVVDDASCDTTRKIVLNLKHEYPNLHLITRHGQRGLGTAVKLGAKHATEGPIVVMDADLSQS